MQNDKGLNLFEKIFNFIKNEEITKFKSDVICAKGEAVQNGTSSSSVYLDKLCNLAKNTYKTTYDRFMNKLHEDKQQSEIKKGSKVFINLMAVLLDGLLTVITEAHTPSSTSQYNDESIKRLDGVFRPPLVKLKDELIDNWNVQAKIEKTKNEHKTRDFLIKDVLVLLITTIIGTVFATYILQKISPSNFQNKSQQNAIIQKNTNKHL